MRVESHPDADRELVSEVSFINAQRVGADDAFLGAVIETVALLADFPHAGSPRQRGVRRAPVPGFRYDVVYKLREDDVLFIIAIAHHSRHPRYWRDRVKTPR